MSEIISTSVSAAAIFSAEDILGGPPKRKDIVIDFRGCDEVYTRGGQVPMVSDHVFSCLDVVPILTFEIDRWCKTRCEDEGLQLNFRTGQKLSRKLGPFLTALPIFLPPLGFLAFLLLSSHTDVMFLEDGISSILVDPVLSPQYAFSSPPVGFAVGWEKYLVQVRTACS